MAVRAHLRGFTSPPPDRSRVLELGCGAGWTLLAFGYTMPGSSFVGIDLSEAAIAQGKEWVSGLALPNVELRAGNVMDVGEADGQFDYIFGHGFLSWVPEPVRYKAFEIIRDRLAPNGVAYLSYNAYPGGHLREMISGMLRFHTRNFTTDADRITQSRGLLHAIVEPPVPETSFHRHVARVVERIADLPPEQILFDELGDENRHFYFHEFVTMAAGYGLEFLGEAELADLGGTLPPKTQALLARIGDRLTREQYLDFFLGRAFRQTMICRAGLQQPRPEDPEALRGLWIGAPMESAGGQRWIGAGGAAVNTSHGPTQEVFARMGAAWPRLFSGKELLSAAPSAKDTRILANILVQCIESGVVRAHIYPPPAASDAGERPCASALARAQIGQRFVPNLACEAIELSSEADEKLLASLDGTLTRAELAELLAVTPEDLDESLRRFVRLEFMQ
jgi:SAM-dependent methyltransferase